MKPSRANPTQLPVTLPLLAALICVLILAGALWQQHLGFAPCPLCILQRIAYLAVLFLALAAAILSRRRAVAAARSAAVLAVLACMAGFGVAAKHVWLVWHPGQTCGLDPLAVTINHWAISQWLPWMFRADGFCADTPYLLGQSLPLWSALGFLLLAALLVIAILGTPRAPDRNMAIQSD